MVIKYTMSSNSQSLKPATEPPKNLARGEKRGGQLTQAFAPRSYWEGRHCQDKTGRLQAGGGKRQQSPGAHEDPQGPPKGGEVGVHPPQSDPTVPGRRGEARPTGRPPVDPTPGHKGRRAPRPVAPFPGRRLHPGGSPALLRTPPLHLKSSWVADCPDSPPPVLSLLPVIEQSRPLATSSPPLDSGANSAGPTQPARRAPAYANKHTPSPKGRPPPRTGLSLLSLGTCLGLAWFVFQQSEKSAKVENQYQLLKLEINEFQQLQSKISLISEKLESTESILQEATSSMSLMTQFEQEVSSLQDIMHGIQNNEEVLTQRMQSLNEKFQNITDFWKRSLEEININTDIFKSEAKHAHSRVTVQINSAEQEIKLLTERLKDLEDSTLRNIRTVKRQEEEDLLRVEEQLGSDTKAVEKLEEEQHALFARDEDLTNKLSDYEPKVEECKTHLPTIESAVHSVLRVSQDLIGTEKKMEDLTMQMFNMEDDMLKAVSEIMEMQKTLEGIQYDNRILKMQNELDVLKEKVHDFIAYSMHTTGEKETVKEYNIENKGIGGDF
ncbi:PREDICTED: inhibitor of nuclear factor kappa-B kinase-interacting protein [Colobus angolensis palliatus]|nr:PREDICTED: inhibitor of nuclear factor kappa-B kinase-interacting protein [Colobus angolensis palliatus]